MNRKGEAGIKKVKSKTYNPNNPKKIPVGILKNAAIKAKVMKDNPMKMSVLPARVLASKHLKFKGSINSVHVTMLICPPKKFCKGYYETYSKWKEY